MDILDNLMLASVASPLNKDATSNLPTPAYPSTQRIYSDFIVPFGGITPNSPLPANTAGPQVFSYSGSDKEKFCSYEDTSVIENSILRHWYDLNLKMNYDSTGPTKEGTPAPAQGSGFRYSSFGTSPYHLIYAYLLENTRMLQIFERMIERYLSDEEFGIADESLAFNWIHNTERLFFKGDSKRAGNLISLIRPSFEATRRNAYYRMFGMDLAFGDINTPANGQFAYTRAKTSNQQFIPLFEKYLAEIWQSYINATNFSGVNTTDINIVIDLATQLREMLIARRGSVLKSSYANQNLSREEFSSVFMTSWFTFILSENTPIVQFLKCQSSSIGERLIKIGNKVGIPAHTKSQTLFELAGAASSILRIVENGGVLDDQVRMPAILKSLVPPGGSDDDKAIMGDFLTVINNWEKATGHKIKNTEANINAKIRVEQNGVKATPVLN